VKDHFKEILLSDKMIIMKHMYVRGLRGKAKKYKIILFIQEDPHFPIFLNFVSKLFLYSITEDFMLIRSEKTKRSIFWYFFEIIKTRQISK
jgi:hypothetical protein